MYLKYLFGQVSLVKKKKKLKRFVGSLFQAHLSLEDHVTIPLMDTHTNMIGNRDVKLTTVMSCEMYVTFGVKNPNSHCNGTVLQ